MPIREALVIGASSEESLTRERVQPLRERVQALRERVEALVIPASPRDETALRGSCSSVLRRVGGRGM